MGFFYFRLFDVTRWFQMHLNPHQLPKEAMCIQWNYFNVPPYICTGDTLVTENNKGKGNQQISLVALFYFELLKVGTC